MKSETSHERTITLVTLTAKAPEGFDKNDSDAFFLENLYPQWFDKKLRFMDSECVYDNGLLHISIKFSTSAKCESTSYDDWYEQDSCEWDEAWMVSHSIPNSLLIEFNQHFTI
jgi:hypothetical protein